MKLHAVMEDFLFLNFFKMSELQLRGVHHLWFPVCKRGLHKEWNRINYIQSSEVLLTSLLDR